MRQLSRLRTSLAAFQAECFLNKTLIALVSTNYNSSASRFNCTIFEDNTLALSRDHLAFYPMSHMLLHNSWKVENILSVQNKVMSRHECCLTIKAYLFEKMVKLLLDFSIVVKLGFRWDVPNINENLKLRQHIS